MAPLPYLPQGQAEPAKTLPPLPKLTKLSTLRRRKSSSRTSQSQNEKCVPSVVSTQPSVSAQTASQSTVTYPRAPYPTIPHQYHAQQTMSAEASLMQQRALPIRLQEHVNTTGSLHSSGQHTMPSWHSMPPRQDTQQRFEPNPNQNLLLQQNQWQRQFQYQNSQFPNPPQANAHHSYGHGYTSQFSGLPQGYPNHSQYIRKEAYQSKPHKHPNQEVKYIRQHRMQMLNNKEQTQSDTYRRQLQQLKDYHYKMQMYKQQRQEQNQVSQHNQINTQQVHEAKREKESPQRTSQSPHCQQGAGKRIESPPHAVQSTPQSSDLLRKIESEKIREPTSNIDTKRAGSLIDVPKSPVYAVHSMQQFGHHVQEIKDEKIDEPITNSDTDRTGFPKDFIPHSRSDIPGNKPTSQIVPMPAKTNANQKGHRENRIIEGHTLLPADTFLSFLKTSVTKEGKGDYGPAPAKHNSYRANAKADPPVRFIDLLDDEESKPQLSLESEDIKSPNVSPPRYYRGSGHEMEMSEYDNPENDAPLCTSSPVQQQVSQESYIQRDFTSNTQEEMGISALSAGASTLSTSPVTSPVQVATLQTDFSTRNAQTEMVKEETHASFDSSWDQTANMLCVKAPTEIDCSVPPANNPTAPENQNSRMAPTFPTNMSTPRGDCPASTPSENILTTPAHMYTSPGASNLSTGISANFQTPVDSSNVLNALKQSMLTSATFSQPQKSHTNVCNLPAGNPIPSQVLHIVSMNTPMLMPWYNQSLLAVQQQPILENGEKTLDAPELQLRESNLYKKISQDNCSADVKDGSNAPEKPEAGMLQGICSAEGVQNVSGTPDGQEIGILQENYSAKGGISAPSALVRTNMQTGHHKQMLQDKASTSGIHEASDTPNRQEMVTSLHKKTVQDTCSETAKNVTDTSCQIEAKTSDLAPKTNDIVMYADLFCNDGDRPRLATEVQCLTCYTTVDGEEACNHMFFGQLKCKTCGKVASTCQELMRDLRSPETCKPHSNRPHRYTEWSISPIDFLCYRLRKQKTDRDGSSLPTFESTLEDMKKYLEILAPLKTKKPWNSALLKCQEFSKTMIESGRQQQERKKRRRSQDKTENKKSC
ncbi:putative mediator of RNA polymerase II transcription subunit 26 [Penaeus japonicus]|uniref:putative mediator of RNA polymerase II transcription subunit 26 n=1 Tax=Penaeus japonicus TaxID=27405 RepID=UPI001C71346D|nr:putative mediator of RNA polymerase II transcription subunit 26 [Penaeus japonicus]XP_042865426.1 putative mediator of RNA polymerase II transcription subunit 26 [Penaeus japonicus]XP_042865427.1 putative mediator of RNA polymerase II transcription subunit 26 [Penaeus japonicus]XP_042865428.1 putative mediator of RNA polymerase II transcription subunit 26 [Penaeus japonicus]